jgi:hypothetical protein
MNKFTVHYPNGIKRHINKRDLDLLGKSVLEVAPRTYFCGSDSLLGEMRRMVSEREFSSGPSFLDLLLIFENPPDREYEREATPRGVVDRLAAMGWTAEATA